LGTEYSNSTLNPSGTRILSAGVAATAKVNFGFDESLFFASARGAIRMTVASSINTKTIHGCVTMQFRGRFIESSFVRYEITIDSSILTTIAAMIQLPDAQQRDSLTQFDE
jgi:hypothetical protein